MEKLYIFGAGGHAKVIIELAEARQLIIGCVVEDNPSRERLLEYAVKEDLLLPDKNWIIAVGDNAARKRIVFNKYRNYISLFHPSANISKRSNIGIGTVVMAGVSINSCVSIGSHCIVNTNASIDHDCVIEDYVHISPNAALAGGVFVGQGTQIGIGASVIQGIKIGKWCIIGAGTVVIRDVPDGCSVVGNPGKIIKINDVSQ
ncbi:acetyltransferase [Sphingobacterium spiritivorum]|uniref:acetyltransferase n=1 Tax=Sphingobacterium spiritivorum TaxID=258 RepID=UPI003DA1F541